MKVKIASLTAIFFLICTFQLIAEEIITLGNDDQWQGGSFNNITLNSGLGGYKDLEVRNKQYDPTESTDLLLHFNDATVFDSFGSYEIVQRPQFTQNEEMRGGGSAIFQNDDYMELVAQEGSLFWPGERWDDFSMEFWLYPANLKEGEILFHWKGLYQIDGKNIPQEIQCRIQNRKLHWYFRNFFIDMENHSSEVELIGASLIPRQWHHHLIRFDRDYGLLEYLIDGVPEGIVHTTPSGREENNVFLPYIGTTTTSAISIGKDFTGFIDEFRLSSEFIENPSTAFYGNEGLYISPIIDLDFEDSRLTRLESRDRTPGNSDIYYFYHLSNLRSDANQVHRMLMNDIDELSTSKWIQFTPGENIPDSHGRFLIIATALYPDIASDLTPSLSSITIGYEPKPPPTPPQITSITSEDGDVTLTWASSPHSDISGYRIYYGNRPGYYFGQSSPIEVDSNTTEFTISGLQRRKLWYFSIVAFSSSSPPQYSQFSSEVSIRP